MISKHLMWLLPLMTFQVRQHHFSRARLLCCLFAL
jgi:hypothetical protein